MMRVLCIRLWQIKTVNRIGNGGESISLSPPFVVHLKYESPVQWGSGQNQKYPYGFLHLSAFHPDVLM